MFWRLLSYFSLVAVLFFPLGVLFSRIKVGGGGFNDFGLSPGDFVLAVLAALGLLIPLYSAIIPGSKPKDRAQIDPEIRSHKVEIDTNSERIRIYLCVAFKNIGKSAAEAMQSRLEVPKVLFPSNRNTIEYSNEFGNRSLLSYSGKGYLLFPEREERVEIKADLTFGEIRNVVGPSGHFSICVCGCSVFKILPSKEIKKLSFGGIIASFKIQKLGDGSINIERAASSDVVSIDGLIED